ncbi:hypothetical protein AUC60_17055 [Pseudomonas caspiana]|uniref:Uncharacterized protein n=1 Tax=Pseudomonas caspiana TaxID=1451454 RepID=A0A1Y3NY81_9PSED|nr:hypothetical protein AUC60_17055 [Pseudomonas caspiana]
MLVAMIISMIGVKASIPIVFLVMNIVFEFFVFRVLIFEYFAIFMILIECCSYLVYRVLSRLKLKKS